MTARLGVMACLSVIACTTSASPVRTERSVFLMGTVATFVVEAPDREQGLLRLEQMVEVVEAAEAELSTWRETSTLSAVNRQPAGTPFALGQPMCDLFGRLVEWQDSTEGAFDPAVGALVEARGVRERAGQSPEQSWPHHPPGAENRGRFPRKQPEEASLATGLDHFGFDPAGCSVTRLAEATLDAGGFGKGEALRRIRDRNDGQDGAWLADFGGQVAVSGESAEGPWEVGLAHPRQRDSAVVTLALRSGSLATSGRVPSGASPESDGAAHIVDPNTGQLLGRSGTVTVWHDDPFVADVLSTALYVMGPERGLPWAEAKDLAVCFINTHPGGGRTTFQATEAFLRRFPAVAKAS